MNAQNETNRCRIVLITPLFGEDYSFVDLLDRVLSNGDVASVILDSSGLTETVFQAGAEKAVPVIQKTGVAALIFNNIHIAGRIGADGVHIEDKIDNLIAAIQQYTPHMIVGMGNIHNRHHALEAGELQPDYIFFDKIGADLKSKPHPRSLALAQWWASIIEIPCIVQAGNTLTSLVKTAATGAEFVALSTAIFSASDPVEAIQEANHLLDKAASRFKN